MRSAGLRRQAARRRPRRDPRRRRSAATARRSPAMVSGSPASALRTKIGITRRRPRARAVGDAEAQDRAARGRRARRRSGSTSRRRAWSPCRGGRAARAACPRRRVARDVAVDPDRARVDDARDARAARGLQHVERAARVEPPRPRRGSLRDVVDVGGGGEVHDRVAAAHRRLQGVAIEQVAEHGVDLAGGVVGGRAHVEDARRDAGRQQAVDDVRADEAGAAGDEDALMRALRSWPGGSRAARTSGARRPSRCWAGRRRCP